MMKLSLNVPILRVISRCFIACFLLLFSLTSFAEDWPQELSGDRGTIVVYQPQPEKLKGNILTGRAAMSLELKDNPNPIFGVFWFSAKIATDRSENTVTINQLKVTKVGWPDSTESDEKQFSQFVDAQLANSSFTASLSKLTASLTSAEQIKESLATIKNDPPIIQFTSILSVLLSYDGDPVFRDIDNSDYQRALNTPLAVIKKKNQAKFYLTSGHLWYQASTALGPWSILANPPADLKALIPKEEEQSDTPQVISAPNIVTATKPTELVVSDGKANWTSLVGGKLLYVENTETPWLRELASGDMYLLLSGRWFSSKSEQGPWVFVRGDKLPQSFKEIPPESAIGGIRTSIAGTDEAEQAVLDAQIPQTAAIKRSEAKLTVNYDGEPIFEKIANTQVEYATNTSAQVLKISGKYYAVDNGVWFVASKAKGPWQVADDIPQEAIAQIPPSSPMYNTTYVTVYDSTPDVVYVGYTPGYMWSYPYYGVPIYGTGWYYPPYYVGGWYYPRPPTWGLHVGYNPWTGWNVGVSWGSPFFRVGVVWGGGYHHHPRPCCGRYYGGGYRGNTNININGNVNIGNSVSIANRDHAKKRIAANPTNRTGGRIAQGHRTNNLYNQGVNKKRNAIKQPSTGKINRAKVSPKRANNVYADKRGGVVRHENGQWQNRSNKNWKTVPKQGTLNSPSFPNQQQRNQQINRQKPNNRSFDHKTMNRDLHGRQMGNMSRGGHQPIGNARRGR
ncbi:carbohydrate-binding family V/XII [Colwellia sp. Bg11-28]|uniref:carbohydrate-binding family V/XII n=1 Tax=Colwellia sp. Bg11-28 TaxID=2058305 RepID=UPI001E2B4328|nr:carbohydrate-binding family V/XII [Colwellia sp. Bg11-28]